MTELYVLAQDYRAVCDKLADLDLDAQTVADTLESLSGDLEVKAQAVAMFARNLEANAAAIKEAEKQMAERRKAIENRAERMRQYLLDNMLFAGIQKIECPYFKLSIRDNPAAVDVYEPGLIPAEYMRQPEPPPLAVDKAAIKEVLKVGGEVPGARLTVGQRLEIR